jgi:hypothetical protein
MKKLLFIILISVQLAHAQKATDSMKIDIMNRRNEVRVDLLSLIGQSKLNLSYERFLNRDFSVGMSFGYSSNNKIDEDFDRGYRNTAPKYEVVPYVRYNLSKSLLHFYFAEIFVSANGGDFKEIVRLTDQSGNGYYITEKSKYSDFGIGGGLGYKTYIKQKFPIEVMVGFGSNLFNRDKSPDTLSRVGLSLGYRF